MYVLISLCIRVATITCLTYLPSYCCFIVLYWRKLKKFFFLWKKSYQVTRLFSCITINNRKMTVEVLSSNSKIISLTCI